jgi:hypothetical protein
MIFRIFKKIYLFIFSNKKRKKKKNENRNPSQTGHFGPIAPTGRAPIPLLPLSL